MHLEKPIILDNVIPEALVNDIENYLLSNIFPWYYLSNIAATEYGTSVGFNHYFYDHINSNLCSDVPEYIWQQIPYIALEHLKVKEKLKPIQARAFLHTPNSIRKKEYDGIHVDSKNPHIVFLYYVNDSDGYTYIFGKEKDSKLTEKIMPQKGRLVIFDGSIYHSSSSPIENVRCIINYNLEFPKNE
jgi:hypothetical protein